MVRELIEIEASDDGWRVLSEGWALDCSTKLQAIEEAHALAARLYVATGRPTGVSVPALGGARMVIGTCG